MSEVYELISDTKTLDLSSLNSFQPELASICSDRDLLLSSHSSIVQSLWRQKGRIDEDVEEYRTTRDKLFNLSDSIKEDSRTRAGRKFEEIAHVTDLFSDLQKKLSTAKESVVLDLCGAPGAFSIFLHKKFATIKIIGFSLKDGIPWFELRDNFFRVFFGADETGDIYKEENRKSILTEISDRSCPLVVADGGFEEISDLQELVMARLIFCEVLTAMAALSDGGNFLCKLFDVFSEFSQSLLFILVKVFTRVVVVKPASSRSVNSERYVVCSDYGKCPEIVKHLYVYCRETWLKVIGNSPSPSM
jgi:23S rRNA U2552 (ribose-2'-O)-methylase RlmE/FtsJ